MRFTLTAILSFVFLFHSTTAQHQETVPAKNSPSLPNWVQLMYSENPNPEDVIQAYKTYYSNNEFVKNGNTQYYKHWLRNLSRDVDGVFSGAVRWEDAKQETKAYLQKSAEVRALRGPTSNWESVGPFDYDHDAAERSYAPGAAHVYTVEKAPSNSNVLYIGTATTGVYKSTDNGLNWVLKTRDYLINGVRALEIDPNDEDIAMFGASGSIYKTTDGGTTWSVIGDATFQSASHYANDIVCYPGSSSIYYLCADDGLYRTSDGGSNWTLLLGGEFQELEFHPTNPNQVYAIRQPNNNTEFYKSTDGGLTWTLKPNGWPGIASTSTNTFDGLDMGGSTSDYVSFATDPEPGNPAMLDFTLELKVRTTGWSSDPAIFANKNWNNGNNRGFVIAGRTNGSGWKFNIGDGGSRIDLNGGTINDGFWHHLTVTYDFDGTKAVYQDGVLINSTTNSISSDVINTGNILALCQDGTLNYSAGIDIEVSDVRVWDAVISAADVETWSCQDIDNTHPNYANLIHHWKCDDGSGTSLTDDIGTNTGTLNGSNTWTTANSRVCTTLSLAAGEEQKRVEIAVTAAEPDYVYALATGVVNGGSGLFGIYKSIDGGETWTFDCCGPQPGGPAQAVTNINMMGWQDDGSDDGGQYYYDLALDVSPTNADKVHVAGVNHWVSTDGGASFTCPSKWSHPNKPEYVHADIHDIRYFGTELWLACDGGLFYSTDGGANISRRMVGIEGTDFWGFGAGFGDNSEVIVGGTYHNGTLLKDNNVYVNDWLSTRGGDNYRGFVNFADNSIVYDDGGKRKLSGDRNTNFEELSYSMKPNATYVIGESSNIEFDARNPNVSYSGVGTAIWKTEDDGGTFTQVYDFGAGVSLGEIRACWSDPNRLYACTFGGTDQVWRSTDGGASWTDITPGPNSVPYNITVSKEDEDILWAARTVSWTWQGTLNGSKVYKSIDGGNSWTNISGSNLDGEYLTNIYHQAGTAGGVYVGTRRAVYYKSDGMTDFELFNNNLPVSTTSTELVGNYKAGKLYNGTNRSVFKVDFYEDSAPVTQIAVEDFSSLCTGDMLQFYSNSVALTGATYNWSFPTGTPSSSNLENPVVSFNSLGTHTVSLTVTDANGSDSQTLPDFITISNNCNPETVPGFSLSTEGNSNSYAFGGDNDNLDFGASTDFTLTTWVKTTTTSSDAVIIAKKDWDNGSNNGWVMSVQNGHLWINVGDGSNRIDLQPADLLNDGEWHHVAASFDRDGLATVYLDGINIASTNMSAVVNIDNSKKFTVGADDEADYPLAALIEEVCIYDAVLSQAEIREQRHLTKTIATPNLITYLQFNEASGDVFDRAGGGNHCELSAMATRTTSSAPVGGGVSQTLDCSSGGVKSFALAYLTIEFPASGTYPNGDLVVSRLDLNPDVLPSTDPAYSPSYWVVNNYGSNNTFSELTSIVFENIGEVPAGSNPGHYHLYKRGSNNDGDTWGASIDDADGVGVGATGSATFSTGNSITSFSQLLVGNDNPILPVELLRFTANLNELKEVELSWQTASEVDNDYFIVEKSRDGYVFEELGNVNSLGDAQQIQSYDLLDNQPYRGVSYYRLKQVDLDGSFSYSQIVSITIEALAYAIVVYPNPAGSQQFLNIETELTEDLTFILFDGAGKRLRSVLVEDGKGKLSLKELCLGMFHYQILGDGFLRNGKVVIVE